MHSDSWMFLSRLKCLVRMVPCDRIEYKVPLQGEECQCLHVLTIPLQDLGVVIGHHSLHLASKYTH